MSNLLTLYFLGSSCERDLVIIIIPYDGFHVIFIRGPVFANFRNAWQHIEEVVQQPPSKGFSSTRPLDHEKGMVTEERPWEQGYLFEL